MQFYTNKQKRKAYRRIEELFASASTLFDVVWDYGGGDGDVLYYLLDEAIKRQGLGRRPARVKSPGEKGASPAIRVQCFVRDKGVCVVCGGASKLLAARVPAARGKEIASVDDVMTACPHHVRAVNDGRVEARK